NIAKKILDKYDCDHLTKLCAEVKQECQLCIQATKYSFGFNKFLESSVTARLHFHLNEVYDLLDGTDFIDHLSEIYSFAGNFDFRDVRANGFRSFLAIVSICLVKILSHLRNLDRRSFSVWPRSTEQALIAYLRCLEELAHCILLIREFPKFSATPTTLFPHLKYANLPLAPLGLYDNLGPHVHFGSSVQEVSTSESSSSPHPSVSRYNELMDYFDLIQQDAFYGRAIAFYLDSSAQHFFNMLASIMAGFADSYQCAMAGISGFVNTVYRSVTSFLSPELRGVRIAEITRSATVNFCKKFWSLAENRLLIEVPNLLLPQMAISHSFCLPNIPVTLQVDSGENGPSTVTICPPDGDSGVSARLISKVRRRGMEWVLRQGHESPKTPAALRKTSLISKQFDAPHLETDPSPYLVVHIHGGGFIAMSSESHDVYIRPWAEKLDCPILSLNYSLAPEAPYPRALDECFYAVCWVMANRERLGARPDARVVVCGDSAGGNLSLGVCLRAASLRLKPVESMPAGAMIAYAPTLVAYVPSPSRMLSISDPLLPIGIVSRCILAYGGVDEAEYLASFELPSSSIDQNQQGQSASPIVRSASSRLWSRLWSSWFPPASLISPVPTPPLDRLRAITRRVTAPADLYKFKDKSSRVGSRREIRRPSSDAASSIDSQSSSDLSLSPLDASDDEDCVNFDKQATGSLRPSNESQASTKPPHSDGMRTDERRKLPRGIDTKLHRIRQCPIPQDGFLSPYLASDELMSRLPPLAIMACQFDPFLDDCLELAKRADSLGVAVELVVANEMPHAFLNFAFINPVYRRATMLCSDMIARLFRGEVNPGGKQTPPFNAPPSTSPECPPASHQEHC
ncbi:unnamed protein product, partial [Mesocestoides corti]